MARELGTRRGGVQLRARFLHLRGAPRRGRARDRLVRAHDRLGPDVGQVLREAQPGRAEGLALPLREGAADAAQTMPAAVVPVRGRAPRAEGDDPRERAPRPGLGRHARRRRAGSRRHRRLRHGEGQRRVRSGRRHPRQLEGSEMTTTPSRLDSRGLDFQNLDGITPEEAETFRESYRTEDGNPQSGFDFLIEHNPAALKTYRYWATAVQPPFHDARWQAPVWGAIAHYAWLDFDE